MSCLIYNYFGTKHEFTESSTKYYALFGTKAELTEKMVPHIIIAQLAQETRSQLLSASVNKSVPEKQHKKLL